MKKYNTQMFFYKTLDYLETYLRKQCARSIHTVEGYRDSLTVFRKFITDFKNIRITEFYITDCGYELIMQFIEYLRERGAKPATINRHLAAIRGYLKYVADCDITFQSVYISVSSVSNQKVPKTIKPLLDDDMIRLILSLPKNNKKGIRNLTMMIMLYETAIRLDELLSIRIEDIKIDSETPYILIHGKGDKERIVVLSSSAATHLNNYINIYHRKKECSLLFYHTIKQHHGKLTEQAVEKMIKKYGKEAKRINPDIPDKVHPHMFRRSRATHMYQDGIPVELISRMLGHASIETTMGHYAKPSLEQMREAIETEKDKSTVPEWEEDDEVLARFGIR